MLRRAMVLLVAVAACGGSDDPPAPDEPVPSEWEALDCAWEDRTGGAGAAERLALSSDGGVVVGGGVYRDEPLIWLRRYSATGEVMWTTETPNGRSGSVRALALDRQDRVGLAGGLWNSLDGDFWVGEVEANGDLAWSMDLGTGGSGEAVCFAPTGELYVTGRILDPDNDTTIFSTRLWVGKFADDGTLLWQDSQGGLEPGQTEGSALVCDESGGVVVAGDVVGDDGYGQTWIRRYDPAGNPLWTTSFPDPQGTSPDAILLDETGDELLVAVQLAGRKRFYRLALADGAMTADLPAPEQHIFAADAGGTFVDGHFFRQTDPECDFAVSDCEFIDYWGYAYYDWDAELVWWRADTTGVPNDERVSQVSWLAAGDGVVALAGIMQDDIWVCHE